MWCNKQSKPGFLKDWDGRGGQAETCVPTNPITNKRQHSRKTHATWAQQALFKKWSLTMALEGERSWFYSNSLVCSLWHQNWLQRPKERVISELPGVFYPHFIKLVFWLNMFHTNDVHKEKGTKNVSWILHPGFNHHLLIKIKTFQSFFFYSKLDKSAASWVFNCHSCKKVSL